MTFQHATQGDSLADVVERVLDKGLVINADIVISLCKTELLSIKLRAALASFETAAKWGLAFPSDMRIAAPIEEKNKGGNTHDITSEKKSVHGRLGKGP